MTEFKDLLFGLGLNVISAVGFGSMFVLCRKYDLKNGMLVQWLVATGILLVGIVTEAILKFPQFQPVAMIGGFLWATGNVTAIPIINTIGLGLGILIWGITNCLTGWASNRYGFFGLQRKVPNSPITNLIGVGILIIGGISFSFVKASVKKSSSTSKNYEDSQISSVSAKRRLIAILLCLFAGVCYGSTMTPVTLDLHGKSGNLNYAFSHYCGIYLTSTAYLLIYVLFTRTNPFYNNRLIFPTIFGGILWGLAQNSWFIANDMIPETITFPINAMLPGVIGALWSTFYFKEIEGKKNIIILIGAIVITLIGVLTVTMSNIL